MFKKNLLKIKYNIDNFTGEQNKLMFIFIQKKLERSLEEYEKEINNQINYLLSKDGLKIKNKIDRRRK